MIIMIPARIGSKGIPKKVLRPFRGRPLINWSIEAALAVPDAKVYVNTDGEEIAKYVTSHYPDVDVFFRDQTLSGDLVTLDELCLDFIQKIPSDPDEILVTVQPTSPFITEDIIIGVQTKLEESRAGSVLTVSEKRKLTWEQTSSGFQPLYKSRVNRQSLRPFYEENGAALACYIRDLNSTKSRVNAPVNCFVVDGGLEFDLDSTMDWRMATEFGLKKNLVAVFIANKEFGSGHFHRAMNILHYLPEYEISVIGLRLSDTYQDQCVQSNYNYHFVDSEHDLINICASINPEIIMLDILDTTQKFIADLKERSGSKVISFEDNGSGSILTDLTINELYPSITGSDKILCGPDYSFLRNEFEEPNLDLVRDIDILISFGGTDPNDLTVKVLNWLVEAGMTELSVVIVLGLGASRQKEEVEHILTIENVTSFSVVSDVSEMADLMCRSKAAITASGRTVYELAACKVETICICQNPRQLTHLFVSEINGITNLGYFKDVKREDLILAVEEKLSHGMIGSRLDIDFSKSKKNVLTAIRNLVGSES